MADRTIVSLAIGGSMEDHHEGAGAQRRPGWKLSCPGPMRPNRSLQITPPSTEDVSS